MKLLSVDPSHYSDAPLEAISRIISSESEDKNSDTIDSKLIEWIRMGTTVATNALLERKGEPTALVVTKGFRDLLEIGNQSRSDIFELNIKSPQLLYEEVVEVDERVVIAQVSCQVEKDWPYVCETGVTGDKLEIWRKPDIDTLRTNLEAVYLKGIRSLAVALIHSYTYPKHEQEVERLAREIGFTHITLSSQVMAMVKVVPRGLCVEVTPRLVVSISLNNS